MSLEHVMPLEYDRQVKTRVYAESGVPEDWIADITAHVVKRHVSPRDGDCRSITAHHRGEVIAPQELPNCRLPAELLAGT